MILRASLFLAAPAVFADGIPIEPGLWEITSTMALPVLSEPRVASVTECMERSEISMDEVTGEGMDPDCSFDISQVGDSAMKWSFDCPVNGGSSHGEWEAVSAGDSVTGKGVMTMTFQNQTMEMTIGWEGKRVGDCP